ncbi:response regulator [Paenibacillus sp. N1-5-1-14]|uniref:response regulator n=1 Tax=Paenibacillus radicibacter TaxID=2972488 RepID=UPI0021595D03|nr:response regulator [Paenibacillus radicibacter]MCR8643442.1 response regulator [Paenibacillus radicibacter]
MAAVMVVDDTAFMRMVMREILEGMGMNVVAEATNGKEAVNLYSKYKPDLVTMDITMPDMDGISALKEIKRADPNAKVIMCTALGQKDMLLDAIYSGAQDFLVKPISKDRVEQAVRKVLKEKVQTF